MTCAEVGPVPAHKLKPAEQGFWCLCLLEEQPAAVGRVRQTGCGAICLSV